MMLRYSFDQDRVAARVEGAVKKVLAKGIAPRIFFSREPARWHPEMGDAVVAALSDASQPFWGSVRCIRGSDIQEMQ
jgi:hypothetical protein